MSPITLPRTGQKVAMFQHRDIRPGSNRHLDLLDAPRKPVNRIEHLLPAVKAGSHVAPVITVARVPGTAPLKKIVERIVAQRSAGAAV